MARPARRPTGWPLLVALVLVVLGLGAGIWVAIGGPEGSRTPQSTCTVSKAGERQRRLNRVEVDQLPDGREGQTYQSDSGCLPVDLAAADS